jgi:hypothetical protein
LRITSHEPSKSQERMGLRNGDRATIEVTNQNEAQIKVAERDEATQRLLETLKSPPSLGKIKGALTRREIHEHTP